MVFLMFGGILGCYQVCNLIEGWGEVCPQVTKSFLEDIRALLFDNYAFFK